MTKFIVWLGIIVTAFLVPVVMLPFAFKFVWIALGYVAVGVASNQSVVDRLGSKHGVTDD